MKACFLYWFSSVNPVARDGYWLKDMLRAIFFIQILKGSIYKAKKGNCVEFLNRRKMQAFAFFSVFLGIYSSLIGFSVCLLKWYRFDNRTEML